METLRAFLSGCMAFLSFSSPKGSAEALPEVFSPCKTCRRRRTQPIPAESGDYLHFLNGFAKSLKRRSGSLQNEVRASTLHGGGNEESFMADVQPELIALGFIWYVAFLFSTTCHEAAHALAAKIGGADPVLPGRR